MPVNSPSFLGTAAFPSNHDVIHISTKQTQNSKGQSACASVSAKELAQSNKSPDTVGIKEEERATPNRRDRSPMDSEPTEQSHLQEFDTARYGDGQEVTMNSIVSDQSKSKDRTSRDKGNIDNSHTN